MLLILVVLFSAVQIGQGQFDGLYAECLTNHGAPSSSSQGARFEQLRGRLEFSIALFKQITKQQPTENVFMSPISIYNTLTLAYFTSAGHTEMSLKKVLALPADMDKTDVMKAYVVHKQNLYLGRYKSQVHNSNRFFISANQTVKNCMADLFHDEIEVVDFTLKGLTKTVDKINFWAANHTNNVIKNLVSPENISPESQIVLANVAYFKGTWKNLFDPIDTKMGEFYISKNKTATTPMMFQLNNFNHWRSDKIQAELLELPYLGPTEDQSEISLILVLPDESNSPHPAADLVSRLDSATLLDIVKESNDPKNDDKVEVKMPKFSLDTTLELTPILENLGVGDLFKPSSNLTGLTGGPRIQLNTAIHKAKVKVDEYGTEAAAATIFTDTRIPGNSFFCDRPFVYLLYDKKDSALLFAGVYNYPTQ